MAVLRGLDRRLLLIAGVGGIVALFFIFSKKDTVIEEIETGDSFLARVMQASGVKENYNNIKKNLLYQRLPAIYKRWRCRNRSQRTSFL